MPEGGYRVMKTIAFDAAKRRTGWAFAQAPGVWQTGIVHVADAQALGAILARAKAAGVTRAVIENCYLSQGDKRNVYTLKTLQEAQTRIRVACELAGLDVDLVYAQTWQAAYGIGGKRPDRKLGAQRVAHALGAGALSEDEADAVCLADYAERVGRQEELQLRGPRGGKLRIRRTAAR
jgi:hypothetical protein